MGAPTMRRAPPLPACKSAPTSPRTRGEVNAVAACNVSAYWDALHLCDGEAAI